MREMLSLNTLIANNTCERQSDTHSTGRTFLLEAMIIFLSKLALLGYTLVTFQPYIRISTACHLREPFRACSSDLSVYHLDNGLLRPVEQYLHNKSI